ncbi:DUF3718 domain-containing protein [Psychrosphaera sp. B3R10]|uniref:DUF3718 domain-containing protein n=1 Tax=Psychrosphaera algicola TaxID=3023714 RepID=A0ABT5FEE1_9GAMM|nr:MULTISPECIES: DUF3718 domain-containing protein [unclassified Psychrosphaera]MBU2883808.1 DUF3718 domain-containing protein [Psychrosphaera sp. I2R16]MBU2990203.1 DUF3718 domain-containing protein [Psychrosphaera sp. B3R10]MDC2889921.1 DUF3718 domain-containing protein [Psychrosphaera sp. G1-22]MDO6720463.1 DUF3718 domain-containing protein [Psychrosphaera sp. 1_MG-2023]
MGIVKYGVSVIVLSMTFVGASVASEYEAADNSPESQLCLAAATASKFKMHRQVADFTPTVLTSKNYRLVANKLYCNGMNVADFAKSAGNFEVANKLMSYRDNFVQIRDIADQRHGSVHIGSK